MKPCDDGLRSASSHFQDLIATSRKGPAIRLLEIKNKSRGVVGIISQQSALHLQSNNRVAEQTSAGGVHNKILWTDIEHRRQPKQWVDR